MDYIAMAGNSYGPKIAMNGTEHTVGTSDNKILHRKLISTPFKIQKLPKREKSRNKHKLRRLGGKYASASEIETQKEEGIILESQPKVYKVELEDEDSDFECYSKSDGKIVHVYADKGINGGDEKNPTLVSLPNKLEHDVLQ